MWSCPRTTSLILETNNDFERIEEDKVDEETKEISSEQESTGGDIAEQEDRRREERLPEDKPPNQDHHHQGESQPHQHQQHGAGD